MGKKNTDKITRIEFNHTANLFLNSGIVALDHYLDEFKAKTDIEYTHELSEYNLVVESENLFQLLEDVYYFMGKEIYDTSGKKARDEADKYYFKKEPFYAEKFPKMKTYGLAGLITNDPQPVPRKKEDAVYFKNLVDDDPVFAKNIGLFYNKMDMSLKGFEIDQQGLITRNDNQKKGDSRIFLNRPYTKTTKIEELKSEYFMEGEKECYLTGEKYKKLVDTQCTNPFFAGIQNFNSQLSGSDKKISWKSMYLSRFCPKLSFHAYSGGLDTILVYMFQTDSLLNLKSIFNGNSHLYKDKIAIVEDSYNSNIKMYSFSDKDTSKDFTEKNDYLFMLTYSFYKNILEDNEIDIKEVDDDFDLFSETEYKNVPVSLISFTAKKQRIKPSIILPKQVLF